MNRLILLLIFFQTPFLSFSQEDNSISHLDTLGNTVEKKEIILDSIPEIWVTPKKTALYSAVLPGLGQVYNRQYWKLPIIYGGLGVAAYFISNNLKNYNTFRQVYAGRVSGDPQAFQKFPEYPLDVIKNARDSYRQDLDLTVLLTVVGYGLQVIDALVFAQLKNFDVSPDISIRTKPVATPQGGLGIGIVMNF